MPSYQDIETRLQVVESKLEFVLKAFQIVTPDNPFAPAHDLLEEYHRVQGLRKPILTDVVDAEVVSDPVEVEKES